MAEFRHEMKYIVSGFQRKVLEERLKTLLKPDENTKDGIYRIRSLYFDDYMNTAYYENENGVEPRAKYRMRMYNNNPDIIKLERKSKNRGLISKEFCTVDEDFAKRIISGEDFPVSDNQPEVLNSFLLLRKCKSLHPVVIVDYDRCPFVSHMGDTRVTLDMNIAAGTDFDHFFEKEIPKRLVMSTGKSILEVKYNEYLPGFIYDALSLGSLQWTAFSKYYYARS